MLRYLFLCLSLQIGLTYADADLAEQKSAFLGALIEQLYQPEMQALQAYQQQLQQQLQLFCEQQDSAQLELLKRSWIEAYLQWKRVESYVFGPVNDNKLQREIGFWPTRDVFIQQLVHGERTLDEEALPMLSIASRGYPALEWIIYTQLSGDNSAQLNQRYCDLSLILADEIETQISTAKGGYTEESFLQALRGERELTLYESVYSELPFAEWLSTISAAQYEIRKLFLVKPAGLRLGTRVQPESVDAYLSSQSMQAMLARWAAMRAIYLGTEHKPSLQALIAQFDVSAAELMQTVIDDIDQQLAELPVDDLPELAEHHKAVAEKLANAMINLEMLLLAEVANALQTQSFFINNDGD